MSKTLDTTNKAKIQEANLRSREQELIKSSLQSVGIEIDDIYEYVHTSTPEVALPLLLDMIKVVTHPTIKQGIIRALGSKSAGKIVRERLISYFENINSTEWNADDTKWVIGNTLEIISDEDILDDMLRIAVDKRHGKSREMVVIGLSKFKHENVFQVLIALLNDPVVSGHAIIALKNFGDVRAVSEIEKKLNNKKSWIRAEARKAIKKLNS